MSYPKQIPMLTRLEAQTRKAMRDMENKDAEAFIALWESAKARLRAAVAARYRESFGGQPWSRPAAHATGTFVRIEKDARNILSHFVEMAEHQGDVVLRRHYNEEKKRAAWMLEQVTPPNVRPELKLDATHSQEAARGIVSVFTGAAGAAVIRERLGAWSSAYKDALINNLALGSLNASSSEDAVAEVDATRAGTPSYDMLNVVERLARMLMLEVQSEARRDFSEDNPDLSEAEIWQTMEDGRVCDECDPNDGLTRDEVSPEDEIPLHPYCRCYWRLAPVDWQTLAGPEMAAEMDARGLNRDAMVIRNQDGSVAAHLFVDFQEWEAGMPLTGGRAR